MHSHCKCSHGAVEFENHTVCASAVLGLRGFMLGTCRGSIGASWSLCLVVLIYDPAYTGVTDIGFRYLAES